MEDAVVKSLAASFLISNPLIDRRAKIKMRGLNANQLMIGVASLGTSYSSPHCKQKSPPGLPPLLLDVSADCNCRCSCQQSIYYPKDAMNHMQTLASSLKDDTVGSSTDYT